MGPASRQGLSGLAALVASGRIAPDWGEALAAADAASATPGVLEEALAGLDEFLAAERAAGEQVLPDADLVLRAFERPLATARVLIVGQDPYPTPGHAVGLSFSTAAHVRPLPRSLKNIFAELDADLGESADVNDWSSDNFWATPERTGDLSAWADAGVLLLNRVLTVRAGAAGSHRGRGWEAFTELAIRALVARGGPLVAILWGNDARALAPLLGDTVRIESAHPSPLSASRGFFGSRPFSQANDALAAQGAAPVEWRL
ncbi:uracil-DNA glycosylase [Leucobacter sp. BZR 635]|uniref:uracil-DNA glycosylase n=1 Tax=Leucobacter sp. BZR 635 TaxID=3378705 RepID=UPI003A8650AD